MGSEPGVFYPRPFDFLSLTFEDGGIHTQNCLVVTAVDYGRETATVSAWFSFRLIADGKVMTFGSVRDLLKIGLRVFREVEGDYVPSLFDLLVTKRQDYTPDFSLTYYLGEIDAREGTALELTWENWIPTKMDPFASIVDLTRKVVEGKVLAYRII